jgi:hypothetical protein
MNSRTPSRTEGWQRAGDHESQPVQGGCPVTWDASCGGSWGQTPALSASRTLLVAQGARTILQSPGQYWVRSPRCAADLLRRPGKLLQVGIMPGQDPRQNFTHAVNAQGVITRARGRSFEASMALDQVVGLLLGKPFQFKQIFFLERYRSATSRTSPASINCSTILMPIPTISIAPRPTKCSRLRISWAGQALLTQNQSTSPGRFSKFFPQAGQAWGPRAVLRRCAPRPPGQSHTGSPRPRVSPAPGRQGGYLSRRCSRKLCRVACLTITPPISTGSSWA